MESDRASSSKHAAKQRSLGAQLLDEINDDVISDLLNGSESVELPEIYEHIQIKQEPQSASVEEVIELPTFDFSCLRPTPEKPEIDHLQNENNDLVANSLNLSNNDCAQNPLNDSFALEFQYFHENDKDLEALDLGFTLPAAKTNQANRLIQTQARLPEKTPPQDISFSCPLPATNQPKQESQEESDFSMLDEVSHSPQTSLDLESTVENHAADMPALLRNLDTADATLMPSSIKQLYDVIKQQYSDFAFIYALSAQLCQSRVPMDAFVPLKLSALLSLASIGQNPDCPPIPLIAIGTDTYMANYLLSQIGELAPRFLGPELDIKAPAAPSLPNGLSWVEADPLLMAKGGVYYAGDWAHFKPTRSDQIFKTIENARIYVGSSSYPLSTAIWAHWRSFKFNAKEQQIFNKFIKIFGIPTYIDDDNHEILINYLLEQASVPVFQSTIDHLSISDDDMRQYIALVSRRTVDLQPAAASLLQRYFIASRTERPDCMSQQAFVVLKQFAESFAKLSFRHEVNELDALAAIYLCENFKQKFFGPGMDPAPAFEAHSYVWLVDGQLTKFREWLMGYIDKLYQQND